MRIHRGVSKAKLSSFAFVACDESISINYPLFSSMKIVSSGGLKYNVDPTLMCTIFKYFREEKRIEGQSKVVSCSHF
jgi:hypothetical protein